MTTVKKINLPLKLKCKSESEMTIKNEKSKDLEYGSPFSRG